LRKHLAREALVNWVYYDHIAFAQVESDYFKNFCKALDMKYNELLPQSHSSLKAWIIEIYNAQQIVVKERLKSARSDVHLSFDLWTSPHQSKSILGIVAHYLDAGYTNTANLLALRRLEDVHSGENIAEIALQVIRDYELQNIGFFVLDNASSNDTAVRAILTVQGRLNEYNYRRLRCLGHIINLAARAFLFGNEAKAFESSDHEELEIAYKLWKQTGPVGQIHYISVFIRSSDQRRQAFIRFQDGDTLLQPLSDNKTRWNLIFTMIQRALLLRQAIDLFIHTYIKKRELDESVAIDDDTWALLESICAVLEHFNIATLSLEGAAKQAHHGSLWECLPMLEYLIEKLEALRAEYPLLEPPPPPVKGRKTAVVVTPKPSTDQFLAIAINNAWGKLDKYYTLTDESIAYVAAVVLNPAWKWTFFRSSWKSRPDWLQQAEDAVFALWVNYRDTHPQLPSQSSTTDPQQVAPKPQPINDYMRWKTARTLPTITVKDEYEHYCNEDPAIVGEKEIFKPIDWWRSPVNQRLYPRLSRLAYNLLSVSAECERVFSSTGILLSDLRSTMDMASIEASECVRNWLRTVFADAETSTPKTSYTDPKDNQ
jgi:hAT family C-terminal dimerisation region